MTDIIPFPIPVSRTANPTIDDIDLPGLVDALGQLEHDIQFMRVDAIRGLLSPETKARLLQSLKTKLHVDVAFIGWLERELDRK